MKLLLVTIYPESTMARYQLSAYVLKAYLARHCRAAGGPAVEVLDRPVGVQAGRLCEEIDSRGPDWVGYSCYVWNIETVLAAAAAGNAHRRYGQILGGPEISLRRIESFRPDARCDYYVIGPGERSLTRLLEQIAGGGVAEDLPEGVAAWRGRHLRYRQDRRSLEDLDEIPSAYLTGTVPEDLYRRRQAFLETQRGCPNRCAYCTYHKNLPAVRYFSMNRVEAELDHLIGARQVQALRICDPVFPSDLRRAKSIVRHLLRVKDRPRIRLPWIYWEFTYDSVDDELVGLISRLKYRPRILNSDRLAPADRPQLYTEMLADYTAVNCVGVQSFSRPALRAVGRAGLDPARFAGFLARARRANIVLKIDLILGLPAETPESWRRGLEWLLPHLRRTDHVLNIHRLQVLPGSDLAGRCDRHGIRMAKPSHIVAQTRTFGPEQIRRASKEAAVLFRVVNSPLRSRFFEAQRRSGERFGAVVSRILDRILHEDCFCQTPLASCESVDEAYWNEAVFSDIPSAWLAANL